MELPPVKNRRRLGFGLPRLTGIQQSHGDTKRRSVRRSTSHLASDLPAAVHQPLVRNDSSQGRPSESQAPRYRGKLISRPDALLAEARREDSSYCWYE
jgi:hypothetical protein